MTTRTLTEVINRIATVIAALTPEAAPTDRLFRLSDSPRPLRTSVPDAGVADMFRRFEVVEAGDRDEFGIQYPSAGQVEVPILVTVVYPAVPKASSLTDRRGLEALIENDRSQIRDEIVLRGVAGAGHIANFTKVLRLDKGDERTWYQDFAVVARFFMRQRS